MSGIDITWNGLRGSTHFFSTGDKTGTQLRQLNWVWIVLDSSYWWNWFRINYFNWIWFPYQLNSFNSNWSSFNWINSSLSFLNFSDSTCTGSSPCSSKTWWALEWFPSRPVDNRVSTYLWTDLPVPSYWEYFWVYLFH